MKIMPYIPPSVVQEVKRMDLLTYLKKYEPYELVHFSGNTYTTRTHDSLKISNGKWMWWSQRTGGRSALDYLIKVRGYSFLEAVELLAKQANIQPSLSVSENVPMEKQLLLPKKNQDDQKVIAYLSGRGIDKEIIQFCLESGRVYESAFHHNAVFVGMDEKDNPKYAAIRGTGTSFIGEANGSDKNYSFSIFTEKSCDTMHLFESAIDLLSYATLLKLDGKEWRREHLLSLAGVYQPAKEIEKSKVPVALARALKMHPEVKTIVFHLDNDRIGRLATKAISTVLPKQYQVKDAVIERNPKTENSYRILRVPKVVMQEVKRRQQLIELRKTDSGIEYKNFDYVCCQENDEPRSLTAMNQALTKICNRNGLPNITVHGLRHMFATILIELGVPLFKISGLLGHSSVHTTYEYYCEIMDEQDKIIAFVNNTFVPQRTETEG
mgnify:CR=1 FL=1